MPDASEEPSNWVDRRALREHVLATQAEEFWNLLRAAIQDACNSFERRFPAPHAVCKLENGKRLRVTRDFPPDGVKSFSHRTLAAVVEFRTDDLTVSIAAGAGGEYWKIDVDEHYQLLIADRPGRRRFSADEADRFSEVVLKPILFPHG